MHTTDKNDDNQSLTVESILYDSHQNRPFFDALGQTFGSYHAIKNIRHIRMLHSDQLKYQGSLHDDFFQWPESTMTHNQWLHWLFTFKQNSQNALLVLCNNYIAFNDYFLYEYEPCTVTDLNEFKRILINIANWINVNTDTTNFIPYDANAIDAQYIQHLNTNPNLNHYLINHFGLTRSEVKYLFAMAVFSTSREAAELLDVSPRTIEKYIEYLKNKVSLKNKTQMHVFARLVMVHLEMQKFYWLD